MAKRKTGTDPGQTFAKLVVTYPMGLNLRAGPGRDTAVLRVLKAGENVLQTGELTESGWMPVDGGWVDSRYVREADHDRV